MWDKVELFHTLEVIKIFWAGPQSKPLIFSLAYWVHTVYVFKDVMTVEPALNNKLKLCMYFLIIFLHYRKHDLKVKPSSTYHGEIEDESYKNHFSWLYKFFWRHQENLKIYNGYLKCFKIATMTKPKTDTFEVFSSGLYSKAKTSSFAAFKTFKIDL